MNKHQEAEYKLICETLSKYNGNRTHTAKDLGISLSTVKNKITEMVHYGFEVPQSASFWLSKICNPDKEIAKKAIDSLKKNATLRRITSKTPNLQKNFSPIQSRSF